MPAITIEDLNNAKIDADKWAEFMSTANPTVTLRSGAVVPSFTALRDAFPYAEPAALQAALSAGVAAAQATISTDQAILSVAARAAAELARDQSYAASRVKASAAAGQADGTIAVGNYFYVVSASSDQVFELWQKDGGTGTDTGKRAPSLSMIYKLLPVTLYSNRYSGIHYVAEDGNQVAASGASADPGGGSGGITVGTPDNHSFQTVPAASGYADSEQGATMFDPTKVMLAIASIGQSFNLGDQIAAGTAVNATPVAPGIVKMLSAGINPGATPSSSLVDLQTTANAEPPLASALKWIAAQNVARFGSSPLIVGFVAAQAGARYYQWKKGSAVWDQLQQHMLEIATIAAAMDPPLRPHMPSVYVMGGESDATQLSYQQCIQALQQLHSDVHAEAWRIFGQVEAPRLIFYANNRAAHSAFQPSAWPIALDFLSRTQPDRFVLAMPTYSVKLIPGNNHPALDGNLEIGVGMARADYAATYGTGRHGLRVKRAYWLTDTTIRVEFEAMEGLSVMIDDTNTRVAYPGGASTADAAFIGPSPGDNAARWGGWHIRDKDSEFGVVSGVLAGSLSVTLTTSRAAHKASTELMVAQKSYNPGSFDGDNLVGARTIIRTTDGITVPGSTSGYTLYDWLLPWYGTPTY
jgi:hypothetical protein